MIQHCSFGTTEDNTAYLIRPGVFRQTTAFARIANPTQDRAAVLKDDEGAEGEAEHEDEALQVQFAPWREIPSDMDKFVKGVQVSFFTAPS